jgi:hypothetical protein
LNISTTGSSFQGTDLDIQYQTYKKSVSSMSDPAPTPAVPTPTPAPAADDPNNRPMTRGEWIEMQRDGTIPGKEPTEAEIAAEKAKKRDRRRICRKIRAYYKNPDLAAMLEDLELDLDEIGEMDLDELEDTLEDIREAVSEGNQLKPIRSTVEFAAPYVEALAVNNPLIASRYQLKGLSNKLTKDPRMRVILDQLDAELSSYFDPGPLMGGLLTVAMIVTEVDKDNRKQGRIEEFAVRYDDLPPDQIDALRTQMMAKYKTKFTEDMLEAAVKGQVMAIKDKVDAEIKAAAKASERIRAAYNKVAATRAAAISTATSGVATPIEHKIETTTFVPIVTTTSTSSVPPRRAKLGGPSKPPPGSTPSPILSPPLHAAPVPFGSLPPLKGISPPTTGVPSTGPYEYQGIPPMSSEPVLSGGPRPFVPKVKAFVEELKEAPITEEHKSPTVTSRPLTTSDWRTIAESLRASDEPPSHPEPPKINILHRGSQ